MEDSARGYGPLAELPIRPPVLAYGYLLVAPTSIHITLGLTRSRSRKGSSARPHVGHVEAGSWSCDAIMADLPFSRANEFSYLGLIIRGKSY
ncbi:hypothetical protein BC834DRAFT_933055 [Gloeopeniophorella convolvens]|nr:hypothetical protein BC834DRAFT_933055 [Gloeopeniophorella convolvens]